MPKVDFVQSDAGYAVEVVSRTKVRYTEPDRTMLIGAEPLLPAGKLALYISERQKWDPPHDDQRLGSIEIAPHHRQYPRRVRLHGFDVGACFWLGLIRVRDALN